MSDDVNVVETDWWVMDLPPEWEAEQDDDSVVIGDTDGVGVIEISTLLVEADTQDASDLAQVFTQLSPAAGRAAQLAGLSGLYAEFEDDGESVRQWCVGNSKLLLIVSYCCDVEDAGMDDSAVDAILDSLSLANTYVD